MNSKIYVLRDSLFHDTVIMQISNVSCIYQTVALSGFRAFCINWVDTAGFVDLSKRVKTKVRS